MAVSGDLPGDSIRDGCGCRRRPQRRCHDLVRSFAADGRDDEKSRENSTQGKCGLRGDVQAVEHGLCPPHALVYAPRAGRSKRISAREPTRIPKTVLDQLPNVSDWTLPQKWPCPS